MSEVATVLADGVRGKPTCVGEMSGAVVETFDARKIVTVHGWVSEFSTLLALRHEVRRSWVGEGNSSSVSVEIITLCLIEEFLGAIES